MFVRCASTFLSCDGGGVGWSGVGWGGVSRLPHRVSPSSRSTAVSGWQRYSQRKPLLPYSQENKHAALSRCIHYVFSIVASRPRAGFLCRLMRSCAVIESTCCLPHRLSFPLCRALSLPLSLSLSLASLSQIPVKWTSRSLFLQILPSTHPSTRAEVQ